LLDTYTALHVQQSVFKVNLYKTMLTYVERGNNSPWNKTRYNFGHFLEEPSVKQKVGIPESERFHIREHLSRCARFWLLAAWRSQDFNLFLPAAQQTVLTSMRLSCERADRNLTINSSTITRFSDLNQQRRLMNVATAH
jgi:hypothetical protein